MPPQRGAAGGSGSAGGDDADSAALVATREHCLFCFETLAAHLQGRPLPEPEFDDAHWCDGRAVLWGFVLIAFRCGRGRAVLPGRAALLLPLLTHSKQPTHPFPNASQRAVCDVEQALLLFGRRAVAAAPARLHRHARAAAAAPGAARLRAHEVGGGGGDLCSL